MYEPKEEFIIQLVSPYIEGVYGMPEILTMASCIISCPIPQY